MTEHGRQHIHRAAGRRRQRNTAHAQEVRQPAPSSRDRSTTQQRLVSVPPPTPPPSMPLKHSDHRAALKRKAGVTAPSPPHHPHHNKPSPNKTKRTQVFPAFPNPHLRRHFRGGCATVAAGSGEVVVGACPKRHPHRPAGADADAQLGHPRCRAEVLPVQGERRGPRHGRGHRHAAGRTDRPAT